MSASVWWLAGGTGRLAQPSIVPLAVAVSTAAATVARSGIVTFTALTPIQVAGVYAALDTVMVTGPFSDGQSAVVNLARPVESVSTVQGVALEESPTRTDALDRTARESSSVT